MPLPNWLLCALSFAAFSVIKSDSAHAESQEAGLLAQERAQAEVLARAAQCDPAALAVLYDQYNDRIYNYIYHRVGQADLTEDLTGQVFMRMLEAVQSGRPWRTSFSGWLYRIAHNLVIDYYRRRQRATVVELEDAVPVQAVDGDPVASTELLIDRQRLRAALATLTEEQAQVITLRFLEELSIAEVADIMDKTEGAIKALQYRAVLALRRVMGP
jgi:RNA polymerase sigma-70 factor (ECF subfamily)